MNLIFEISPNFENKTTPIAYYKQLDNGAKTARKYITIADLVTALSQPVDIVRGEEGISSNFENETRIPILPPNTLGYSSSKGTLMKERVTIVIPKGVYPIQYIFKNIITTHLIGFPKLIMQNVVVSIPNTKQRRIVETYLFAIKDDRKPIDEQTELYSFPFPNVDKTTGGVCWGANADISIEQLSNLDIVFTKFISAPFNEDYGCYLKNGIQNFKSYLELEVEDVPFNDDYLLPTNKKVGQLYGETYLNEIY